MGVLRFLVFSFLTCNGALSFHVAEDKLVDLSYPMDESTIGWLTAKPFQLNITQRGMTAMGSWMQEEDYASGTHVGTHMDAPCHVAEGRWTMDQIPLEHFVARAAVVDITRRVRMNRDAFLLVEDFQEWELETGDTLDDTIVLVRTGFGRRWPDREAYMGNANNDLYNLHFPGVSPEAADWLVRNRKVYGLGIEGLSLDNGPNTGRGIPTHQILLGASMYGIENVANLHNLPISGAIVHAFPMNIRGACGGPVRLIAHLP